MTTPSRRIAPSILAASIALAGCGGSRPTAREAVPAPVALETASVEERSVPASLELDGTIVAKSDVLVGSRLAAQVASVEVRAGDGVKKGQVLVRLDVRETESALAGARATLAAARSAEAIAARNRQRFESLARDEAATALELDRARLEEAAAGAQVAAAAAAVRRAETDLAQAVLVAPADAVVVDRLAEPGDLALPGKPLVRLAAKGARRVEAAVPETARVAVGQVVAVLLDASRFDARVTEVVGAADPSTRTRVLRAELPAGLDPAPGSFARVLVPLAAETRLLVPAAALSRSGGLELVWVVGDGGAEPRYVQTGSAFGDDVEVRAGLRAGERVVLRPPASLRAGAKAAS